MSSRRDYWFCTLHGDKTAAIDGSCTICAESKPDATPINDAYLEEENKRLNEENNELNGELAAANRRIAELEGHLGKTMLRELEGGRDGE